MKDSSKSPEITEGEGWVAKMLKGEGLACNSTLELIHERMGKLADRSQPVAKSRWLVMVVLQGMCVLVPVVWFVRPWAGISASVAAGSVLACVASMVMGLWWMRWRGMQKTWARARLIAEVARGRTAGAVVPGGIKVPALNQIEALSELPGETNRSKVWPDWVQDWTQNRLDDQLQYYTKAKARADKERASFTRVSTLMMDVMLALSVSALLVMMSSRADQWRRVLGGHWLEIVLGLSGMVLPLVLILSQTLRSVFELNRRSARFARQIAMLETAKGSLGNASTEEETREIVEQTEGQLLSEVVDWFFEAESAEKFFEVRQSKNEKDGAGKGGKERHGPLLRLAWIVGGVGFFFLIRVVLGRAPWVLGASGVTLCWLAYATPSDADLRAELKGNGMVIDASGKTWTPDVLRKDNGCIIIAHGLHDGAIHTLEGVESRWMREMGEALEKRLSAGLPNIGLVDWHVEASPTENVRLRLATNTGKFLADLSGIRPQGHEVGDFLAFRLSQWILEGKIRKDQPLHLIGHSAGGFVVSRAALRLSQMNLAPEVMRVTILDTPAPDAELLEELPKRCRVDFYITSGFVVGLDPAQPPEGVHLKRIESGKEMSLLEQHSFAHQWFIRSIPDAQPGDDGFGQSPFCQERSE